MTPRPKRDDCEVVLAAARELAEELCSHYSDFGPVDKAAAALAEVLEDGTFDGYTIAKELEGYPHNWFGLNAECVEILDDAMTALSDAHEEAVAAWVKAEGVLSRLAVGATVTVADVVHEHGRGTYEGKITRAYLERAQYLVCFPALGHVEKVNWETGEGVGKPLGYYLDYEKVEGQPPLNVQPELV